MPANKSASHRSTVGFARLLPWSSLLLILGYGLVLSLLISNSTKQSALTQQQDYALLLARNLNHQIYRRFILPTIVGFGHVELKDEVQYHRLDEVIGFTTMGLNIQEVRIYDLDRVVSYCTVRELVGLENLAGVAVLKALEEGKHTFEFTTDEYSLWDIFRSDPDSVILKTTYPLRAERDLNSEGLEGPIIGVVEFTQDITEAYKPLISYQWIIIITTLVSSMVLFLLLYMIMRRVERMNQERSVEREQLERELHQSEKLASIGRMVAGIAHEIRNPLGIIRSSSELLLNKIKPENGQSEVNARILGAIHEESKRLSQTMHDFLDYARPKQPKQETVDLAKVLDQALVFLESECAKHQVTVKRKYSKGLTMLGDKDFLYRAVYNILTNAMQAMDEEQPGTITVSSRVSDGKIELIFEDTGVGFDKSAMEKLFDPFFTTKDNGTGLGLAILKNIVSSHQGDIQLNNREQGGAMVRLIFPKL
ncbi:MAG: GHKL domain-containing protein [Desulfovibrio sp.]|nr:MAG: GHKL domain-containing protein [Desulfovibrio sp.]